MASWNCSRDVGRHHYHYGGNWRPPLPPQPDSGESYRPVPLWERKFCRGNAYDIPWEIFCENKRFIGLFQNVMDWDDSGARTNFEEAKERFRAKYFGEPFEDPVLDPDMYIDEVDHNCQVDPKLVGELDKVVAGRELLVSNMVCGGMGNLIPTGWGQPVPNLKPTGWGDLPDMTPNAALGGQGTQTPEAVSGAQPYCTPMKNSNNNFHGGGSSRNPHQQETNPVHTSPGTGVKLTRGGGMLIGGTSAGGAINWNVVGGGGILIDGVMHWSGGSGRWSNNNWHQQVANPGQTPSATGAKLTSSGGLWIGGSSADGARNWNGGGGGTVIDAARHWSGGSGRGRNNNQHQQEVDQSKKSSGTRAKLMGGVKMWISGTSAGGAKNRNVGGSGSGGGGGGGGGGRNGSGSNWNVGGRGNHQRTHDEGQHQQRAGGGKPMNQDEGRQHLMRSGGGGQQQQQQGLGRMKMMKWRPVMKLNRASKDDPAA